MIQPLRPQDAGQIYQRQVQQADAAAGDGPRRIANREAAQGRRTDRVSLSPVAQDFARALQQVNEQPDVRSDRVAALQAQIADGTYRVDADAIARRLVVGGLDA